MYMYMYTYTYMYYVLRITNYVYVIYVCIYVYIYIYVYMYVYYMYIHYIHNTITYSSLYDNTRFGHPHVQLSHPQEANMDHLQKLVVRMPSKMPHGHGMVWRLPVAKNGVM